MSNFRTTKVTKGFSLLEMLIVIAIMAVLAAIAIPSYTRYVVRAQRVEARDTLQAVASQIEQNYLVSRNYKLTADKRPLSNDTIKDVWKMDKVPPAGTTRYEISIASITETGYTLQAKAVGLQAQRDKDCPYFFYNQSGARMASKTATVPAAGSRDSVSLECWSK